MDIGKDAPGFRFLELLMVDNADERLDEEQSDDHGAEDSMCRVI